MREKKNVMIVMFDVPVTGRGERKDYTAFVKHLLRSGYTRLQKSIYVKLLRSREAVDPEILNIRSAVPAEGEVSVLPMPLSLFKTLQSLRGNGFDFSLFSDDLVFI